MAGKTTSTVKETVLSPVFRLTLEYITKPRKNDDGTLTDPPKYDFTGAMEVPENLTGRDKTAYEHMQQLLKKAIALGIQEGHFTELQVKNKQINFPWQRGDEWIKENPDKETAHVLYEGKLKFTAKSTKVQPGYGKQTPNGFQNILDPQELYPGCYCVAELTAYAYHFGNQRGVMFGVNNVMRVRDGEPIAMRRDPARAFEGLDPSDFGNDNSSLMGAPEYDEDLGI